MKEENRRSFIKKLATGGLGTVIPSTAFLSGKSQLANPHYDSPVESGRELGERKFNDSYKEAYLNRVAFPLGGIGAGMFCLEGTGAISHMSIRNRPEIFHEPAMFAAIVVKGFKNGAKVLEGPVPEWKIFGQRGSGNGGAGSTFGLPRFEKAAFTTRFPFGTVELLDPDLPLVAKITGWSPFIPTDEDNSSLPVGGLEYSLTNTGTKNMEVSFSFNSKNFLASDRQAKNSIHPTKNGFILHQEGTEEKPFLQNSFAVFTDDKATKVDYCWFRGGWWDPVTMVWNDIRDVAQKERPPVEKEAPGASLFIPFSLAPGKTKIIRLKVAWYSPFTTLKIGEVMEDQKKDCDPASGCCSGPAQLGVGPGRKNESTDYAPWYSSKFGNINEVIDFWGKNYMDLKKKTNLFSDSFYKSTLPPEVIEAVAANLTIIKSTTVLRQYDGRLWAWEGCGDEEGCCHGSCTHVWNYAQAIPHLFPSLERSLRNTEFCENQDREGHQAFRANLPISPLKHDFYPAADGQLGGIMKVYRDWRISGDNQWLAKIYPMVKVSMDYCINTWDPRNKGIIEEPHHNTYDIEFWGPEGMCTSFYLGALASLIKMGEFLEKEVKKFRDLLNKGKRYLETKLYNGEYFFQEIVNKGLNAPNPATARSFGGDYSPEAIAILQQEGPKYQYGKGCLSDGILGAWLGRMSGLQDVIDPDKITSHLIAVYTYNLKKDLREHANPQRPNYAIGNEGGLLLCTWPKGGKLSLPFVYSDEVWTGIEYQVASHLMLMGKVKEGLAIVRECRARYDGRFRNPFNEYECGHWYARAMSSYGLLQGLTGVRYDAVDKTLYIDSKIGDFTSFISTATGFGNVSLKANIPALDIVYGKIEVDKIMVSGKEVMMVKK